MDALTWWRPGHREHGRGAIICDGAVRSGKTLCLSLSFVFWALADFRGGTFALCGKTVTSLRRNVVTPLLELLPTMGFRCDYKLSRGYIDIEYRGNRGRFYLFGGKDEGSAALIQGITLAGILMDEVALMPRSCVEPGLARCSVAGSRFWFNCNPEHPSHWFYREWIEKREEKNVCYLHFTMDDNPSLTREILERYKSLYTGVFYERYVLGKWTSAHGAVYPMFDENRHVVEKLPACTRYVISCDYGTLNPASFGLWGQCGEVWYRVAEYYYSGREAGELRTDEEYCDALEALAGGREIEAVIVDPSAASFIQCVRRRGKFPVIPAKNSVLDGIRLVSDRLRDGTIKFHRSCGDTVREFHLYRWDLDAADDRPVKENDHAMDEIRYFVAQYLGGGNSGGFFATGVARGG
jgi:PBSX family phage terminase large subunit